MPHSSHRSGPLLSGLCLALAFAVALPPELRAQIASPSNAGGNAGNNSSGSTITPISTPTFTPVVQVPAVQGVTVSTSGSITTVTASPVIITAVTTAVVSTAPANSLLAPVVFGAMPSLMSLTSASPVDVVLTPASGPSQQPNSVTDLVQEVAGFIGQGQSLTVSTLTAANLGSITPTAEGISVTIAGQEIQIAASVDNQAAVSQFAAIAIVGGLSAPSLSLGASLVLSGADPVQVARLMVGLQGLANTTELTSLSTGIDAFNTLVQSSNDATVQALASQELFAAARSTLLAARSAIGG